MRITTSAMTHSRFDFGFPENRKWNHIFVWPVRMVVSDTGSQRYNQKTESNDFVPIRYERAQLIHSAGRTRENKVQYTVYAQFELSSNSAWFRWTVVFPMPKSDDHVRRKTKKIALKCTAQLNPTYAEFTVLWSNTLDYAYTTTRFTTNHFLDPDSE